MLAERGNALLIFLSNGQGVRIRQRRLVVGPCQLILSLLFDSLDTHDGHEVVRRVRELRALVVDGCEVVDRLGGLVEVDDLALRQQHQLIHHFEHIRVRLVNCLNNGAALA